MSDPCNWHEGVFFGIHYDLHAKETDTELGVEATAEHFRERWAAIRPDWIQCDCKGHPGYTSWPTETGSTSPGVVRDAMRVHREVTKELGIRLGMHYSGVIDQRALELSPEWGAVNAKGELSTRSTCRLSPYADELMIPQMLELVDKYDVDGFWVDGENWGSQPCWCDRCRAEFTARTGIAEAPTEAGQENWGTWLSFQRDLFCEYVTKYATAVHERKPTCLICSNWMYTIRQPEPVSVPVDYLSGDYTPNWGAARAALEARMLDCRGMTWDLMVWGFTRNYQIPTSPWAMKTAVHLKQEVAEVVALGGAVMVYAKPHRSGWLTGWEHEIIAETAEFCRERKAACFRSKTASEAAVLHLDSHYYTCNDPLFNYGGAVQPVEGALNILLETHRSTDLLTEEAALARMGDYKLLVVPEQTRLSPDLVKALASYVEAGGELVMSGAGLATEVPDLVGCTTGQDAETVQLAVRGECAQMAGKWSFAIPAAGTDVLAGNCRNLEPGLEDLSQPVITVRPLGKGRVVAIHGDFFRNYFAMHFPRIRASFEDLVAGLDIEWTVELAAPAWVEVVCRRQGKALMVNLLNRGSGETLSPQRTIVEDLPSVESVTVAVRAATPPSSVTLEPDGTPLPWNYADGIIGVTLPTVRIHDIVAIR
jgi:hypothetical protein